MTATAQADFVRLDAGQPGPRQVALVSGMDVPLFRLDLPAGLRGQAREQVARRQLADRLGMPADQVEMRPFAIGAKPDLWDRVLITAPEHLAQWRRLSCRAVLPDYLSLPCAKGLWTVVVAPLPDGMAVLVRLGPEDGFTAPPELLAAMLDRALKDAERPKAIYHPGPLSPQLAAWASGASAQGISVVTDASSLDALDVPHPQVLAHAELSCDLRADPQAARAHLARRVLPWRWPVLAACLAAGLWSAEQMLAINRITDSTRMISAATVSQVQQHFVPSGPVLDVRVQVSRALTQARTDAVGAGDGLGDPVDLGWRVAEVVTSAGATPETMAWAADTGLSLALRVPDFAAADRMVQALTDAGLDAEQVDTRASADATGVRAEYRIQHPEVAQ